MLSWMRRAAALAVALLCVLPLYRLLDPERNGAGGADALARAEPVWSLTVWGSVLVGLVGIVGGALASRFRHEKERANGAPSAISRALLRPPTAVFALAVSALAAGLTAVMTIVLQRRLLTSVDEMAALIHARYLAAGALAGTLPDSPAAWLIPNTGVTDGGWVSQYPPGHLLVWAAFLTVGVGWAVGPALYGATVGLVAASLERLLPPEHGAHGRAAALLLALSPFMLILTGGSPSHVTAGAAGALALYAAVRAADGRGTWALIAGAAVGAMVLTRPWTGLVLGPTLTLGVWLERGGIGLARRRLAPWILGGAPFALVLLWFDAALFGSAFTLGYEAMNGPSHGLGLHADPWSFPYGVREAVGYTSADLVQLGAMLLETPVSVLLVAAAYLALVPRLAPGLRVVAAWALLPVFANALYWFHAPRMLSEAAPAWIILAVIAVAHAHGRAGPAIRIGLWSSVAATLLVAVVAFVPSRVRSQAWTEETLSRITIPEGAADGALVFVHAAWSERMASMLQAGGMRQDSIQPIVRRNDACRLHQYAVARLAGATGANLPAIDLEQTSSQPAGLVALQSLGSSVVWRGEGDTWSDACVRELSADRYGAISLAPLLWQGDLPGLERGEPMFVRDYGWERNDALLALFPGRDVILWAYPPSGRPVLLEYEPAMATLWGSR
jgi:hypothetical protein